MDIQEFIDQHYSIFEKAHGLNYYIELLDGLNLGKDQDHKAIIDALLKFINGRNVIVLKMNDDRIDGIVDITKDDMISNLYCLGDEKGLFHDEDLDISYAIANEDFFAYVLPNNMMLSADKETITVFSSILDDFSIQYFREKSISEKKTPKGSHTSIQFKISLNDIKPDIWRRFVVNDDISLHELHTIIQIVMGWEDYHAYNFRSKDVCIEGEGNNGFCVDSMWKGFHTNVDLEKTFASGDIYVNNLVTYEKQEFEYVYDLGDRWIHKLVVEKIFSERVNSAIVIDGARCCPPEDSGGVYGYFEMLEIQKDPSHELYEERIVDWLGEDFDSEFFDIQRANRILNDVRSWREDGTDSSEYSTIKMRKLGRNEPCYCGSEKKYKKCCLPKDMNSLGTQRKIPI
ncbi:hypothetical protein B6U98_05895 [Thermoplasmatales archaeon ex4572_165]|nr:MAG: hypothetical protein B6U98_05895 [Thermoplasmatales archaeon ex4572_165]